MGSVDEFRVGQRVAQRDVGIGRQERRLVADPPLLAPDLLQMLGCGLGRVDRAPEAGLHRRRPERVHLMLAGFHAVAEIAGMLGLALLVDQHGQIAAVADGIHRREEDEFVAAEQVLDIVLGARQQDVEPGVVHRPVDAVLVERNGDVGRAA